MSDGEAQVASLPVDRRVSPRAGRRLSKRTLVINAVLLMAGLLAYCFQSDHTTLSAEEAALVGSWEWQVPSIPPKAGDPPTICTFTKDKRLLYSRVTGLESSWKIVNGRLKITHYYRMTLFRDGPVMPMRKAESVWWKIGNGSRADRVELQEGQISTTKLPDAVMLRSEESEHSPTGSISPQDSRLVK